MMEISIQENLYDTDLLVQLVVVLDSMRDDIILMANNKNNLDSLHQ